MDEPIATQWNLTATPEETKTLEEYSSEMSRLRVLIDAEQDEIERLKIENSALKAETRAMLTTLKAAILT